MGETGREAYAAQPDCRTIDRLLQAVSVTEKMNAIWGAIHGLPRICPAWSGDAILTLQHSHRRRSDGAAISIQTGVARADRQSALAWLEICALECWPRRPDIQSLAPVAGVFRAPALID
jgi:hypothetical protein